MTDQDGLVLFELYRCKEALHRFYRTRGLARAHQAFTWLTDQMARSSVLEIQRTEGFNNKAKLVKKRAYGYESFENYRLRLLNACRG